MNNNRHPRFPQDNVGSKRLTKSEMDERYIQGGWFYHLAHIPRGQRDWAIQCVGFYLWRIGFGAGEEENRLLLLSEWFFSCMPPMSEAQRRGYESKLRRAVYWKAKDATKDMLSDDTIDRMMELKVYTLEMFKRANTKSEIKARTEIVDAIEALEVAGEKITHKAIQRLTGRSLPTIRKHRKELSKRKGVISLVGVQGSELNKQKEQKQYAE